MIPRIKEDQNIAIKEYQRQHNRHERSSREKQDEYMLYPSTQNNKGIL